MSWADAAPNLLIGLREGLEAGLVVTILLAAIRRTDAKASTAPVWAGVAAATVLSLSFGAVLSAYSALLSTRAQEAVSGALSVGAVVLITAMIFWMRRTARTLSGELRAKVASAARLGAAAVALTAFLAVGREGLETALFIWTAVQASGHTTAPLAGAGLGLLAAFVVCLLLFRKVVRINLGVFFSRTAILLIVVAAGVFSYGLGDLQDAGLLPGHALIAFDVSGRVASDSWWASFVTGVTDLSTRMTWLQLVGWLGYLAAVLPTFVVTGRQARPAAGAVPTAPATPEVPAQPAAAPSPAPVAASTAALPWWQRRRGLAVAAFAALLVVPAAVAGGLVAVRPAAASAQTVQVTARACAPGWTTARTGQQTFSVTNASGRVAEVNLVQASTGGVVAEIETLGPGVTVPLSATLADAAYQWRCLLSGAPLRSSATVTATGAAVHRTVIAVVPVTRAQLRPATVRYRGYVERRLSSLSRQVTALHAALAGGSLARSRADWLRAQLTWESIGAAYGSFGSLGAQVDGLPFGLPRGVHDPAFTGLHRIEWALWHGRAPRPLARLTGGIRRAVAQIATRLPALTADPTDLPVRAHEILEDAERDHLSGFDDLGSGAAYAETHADVAATRVALRELAPQLQARVPGLLPAARSRLAALDAALAAARVHGGWPRLPAVPTRQRARVDAATGAALEVLDRVPDVLEVPAH